MKVAGVQLMSDENVLDFDFLADIPGLDLDVMDIDFDNLYDQGEIEDLDVKGLRDMVAALPCCVKGGDKKTDGDPLNIVIIADGDDMLIALASRGWHATEKLSGSSTWGMVKSSVFGSEHKTSPISPLYLFERSQDIGLQKARGTVDERNHMRLWLSPYRFEGKEVWVGQISRDIGVRLSRKTFVTHEIDPQVDEARDYLVQDLLNSRSIEAVAWVEGVGAAHKDEPRYNFTLSPYFTDGFRAIMLLSDEPTPLDEVELYDWDLPPSEWE